MTALKFMEVLDRSGGSVSELNKSLPTYFQVKKRVECPNDLKSKVLNALAKRFDKYKLDRTDGLRVAFRDGWLLVRPSGTEPIFRCFAEAKTRERAEELAAFGIEELKSAIR